MAKLKYRYRVSFDEKVVIWTNIDAMIESDVPLTEEQLNEKVKKCEYEEISSDFDWTDGTTRLKVSPIYDYTEEEMEVEDDK